MRTVKNRADLAALVLVLVSLVPAVTEKDCSETSTGLIPLTDLGTNQYLGHEGGLYATGANDAPAEHIELGLEAANLVQPLDQSGTPEPNGAIGLISIGVSNTMREFNRFMEVAADGSAINPQLVLVNGAQGGQGLEDWSIGPEATPWFNLAVAIEAAGLNSEQVQVAWLKVPDRNRGTPDIEDADTEIGRLAEVVRIAKSLYPNLRLAYMSSRIYGGYAATEPSEPSAYQNGFAVKMLIERQIEGDPDLNADTRVGPVVAPWLAWGPYLWADGLVPRSDGLVWECNDFDHDGIHPAKGASEKVARLLMEHFSTHLTSVGWFLDDSSSSPTGSTTTVTTSSSSTSASLSAPLTSSDRPGVRQETIPRGQRPGRGGGGSTVASGAATGDLQVDAAWLMAGLVLGFGVSFTLSLVWARSQGDGDPDR